ncbi:RNA-directed DNA polymerase, eukaryota [Tanacetum coccineum]
MRNSRSKEDEVQRISTSVFVTNFPKVFSAKDLWNTCKQYGQVVDAYIPNKRSKAGKRFGFVRFVKVFDMERLVNNLYTVWVGRYKLHANIPRFQREPLNKHSNLHNNFGEKRGSSGAGNNKNGGLSNPKGFMVFDQALEKFKSHVGVGSWFSSLEREDLYESDEDTFDDEFGKDNSKVNMNFNSEGESDKEEVQETIFRNNVEDEISNGSLNYPLGFTPIEEGDKKFDKVDKLNGKEQGYTENANEQVNNVEEKSNKDMSSLKEEDKESRCSGHFRRVEGPKTGGSILQLLDDVVKVGQTMGYKMDGCVIDNWSGETIIMGDFNEVRSKEERYGSIFNDHNASLFNSFISSGGLVEVSLGGCAFTWCHKGNKMSKLDQFLISEGLMGMCPNISAITLDRYLSDHRTILLREVCHDYGPYFLIGLSGKVFDEWIKILGVNATSRKIMAFLKFMKKAKILKEQIKVCFVRPRKKVACMQK